MLAEKPARLLHYRLFLSLGYIDIGLIPKGARDIRVMEIKAAGNFLAIRSEDPEKYYLNGGFIIQWNGNYKLAGTVFQYDRKGDLERLMAPGPTNESVWLQVIRRGRELLALCLVPSPSNRTLILGQRACVVSSLFFRTLRAPGTTFRTSKPSTGRFECSPQGDVLFMCLVWLPSSGDKLR